MCLKKTCNLSSWKAKCLKSLDIFGVEINIKFNQQNKHRTSFGGFITLIIVGILSLLLTSSIQQIILKSSPNVVMEEKFVTPPSRYNLTKDNFSFVISLFDEQDQPMTDERIFKIQSRLMYKSSLDNQDDGNQAAQIRNKTIAMSKCQKDNFKIQDTESYFLRLDYQKMFCINDYQDLYLEGQEDSLNFSYIEVLIVPCYSNNEQSTSECLEKSIIDSTLAKSNLKIYFSNSLVQIENFDNPFQSLVHSTYWQSHIDQQQNIELLFQNTYILDDVGMVLQDFKETQSLLFRQERTILSNQSQSLFQVSLSLQQNQERYYRRSYTKITESLSKIGGIYNFLFIVGCIIVQPYSQMELHRKLFNQTFQVAKTSKKKSKDQEGNTSLERRCQQPSSKSVDFPSEPKTPVSDKKIKFTFSPRQKKPQNSPKVNDIARRFSLFNVNQSSNSIDKNQKVPLQQTIVSAIRGQIDNFKVKTSEYFSYYLNCFKIFNSDITEMVSFGTQKIYDYTDICFIVNKLLELEKLKHLILNEQQIKLFEFIPKPKIDLQIIGKYQNQTSEKEFKDSKQNNLNDDEDKTNRQGIQSGGDINGEDAAARKRKQINILSIQNRSLEEKANQAQLAFNHIYKNQLRKSKVDLKLIQMLDENLVQLFNSNTFDDNSTLFSGSIGGVNPEIDAMTFSKGISLHRIKLEKSHFRKQSEADSEINDPNEEMIDSTNRDRPCSYQTQGIILYENKQKNFIADTEKRNCSTFDIQKEDDHKSEPRKLSQIMSQNQKYMEEFTQFDPCYPKTEGKNFEIITEDQ